MLNDIKLLDTMSGMAKHASQRHALIAGNIANADTPGYKAQDLEPFAQVFEATLQNRTNIKTAQPLHIDMEVGDNVSPNGNTVSLEQQMVLSAQTKADHDMALAVYKKSLDMMRMALGKNT